VGGDKGFVEANGTEHFFYVLGNGDPLIVLHGGPGTSHEYFLPHLNPLSERYQLIFYDQRGSGNSPKPAEANTVTADNFVKDLEEIRIAFGLEKIRLLGHSWGGLLAALYASDYPDRVESLVLVDSAPPNSELDSLNLRIREERRDAKDQKEMETIMNSEEFRQLDPEAITRFFKISEKVRFYDPHLIDRMSLNIDREKIEKLMWVGQLMNPFLSDYDVVGKLPSITSPTLIIHGDYDTIPLQSAEIFQEGIKDSKLVVFENCGHFPFVEAPGLFMKEVCEFLEMN
jgi:proline iminopeptidase